MPYNADIICGSNTAQSVDFGIHAFFCGNGAPSMVDEDQGARVAATRAKVVREVNDSLGTSFESDSVVITDCPRADYGICVMTPNPGGATYTLDIFRPFDQTRYQSMIAGHCLIDWPYDPLTAEVQDTEGCEYSYTGPALPLLTGSVVSTMEAIEEIRAEDQANINLLGLGALFEFLVAIIGMWLGIDLTACEAPSAQEEVSRYPTDGFPAGGGDGGSLLEPVSVNNGAPQEAAQPAEEVEEEIKVETTPYPMQVFAGRGDGMTAGR